MVKACETLMDNHDASDVLENVLTKAVKLAKKAGSKQLDREALERRVCYELTVRLAWRHSGMTCRTLRNS